MVEKLLMIGGDLRMELLGRLLAGQGVQVHTIRASQSEEERKKIAQADALLFPYPFAIKEGSIPGWRDGGAEQVLMQVRPGTIVMAGAGLETAVDACERAGHPLKLHRYADEPAFVQRNAEISAEAAVCEAMQRTQRMLDEQNVLILGYGLFAQAIAWRLRALGVRVWVAARREKARMQAAADGLQAVAFEQLDALAPEMDIVMNTVPSVVLDRQRLARFSDHALLMEMASPPYGIDLPAAVELGKNAVVLPGLPSRYAPQSAAQALLMVVEKRIREERT